VEYKQQFYHLFLSELSLPLSSNTLSARFFSTERLLICIKQEFFFLVKRASSLPGKQSDPPRTSVTFCEASMQRHLATAHAEMRAALVISPLAVYADGRMRTLAAPSRRPRLLRHVVPICDTVRTFFHQGGLDLR
jgi:hypothetical protein